MFLIYTADLIIAPIVFALMVLFMAGYLTCTLNYEHNWLSRLTLKLVSSEDCMVIGGIAMIICVLVYFSLWISVITATCFLLTYGLVRWCHESNAIGQNDRLK